MTHALLLLPAALTGCSAALRDPTFATGSRTVVTDAAHGALYVVDGDGNAVVRHDATTGATTSISVGAEPTRIARAGDVLVVTLRGERAVALVEDRGGTLALLDTVEVGAEPYGVVAREDGDVVYVALAGADEVVELDVAARSVTRSWALEGHPSFLALHPSDRALYVGAAVGGGIDWIDLDDGTVTALQLAAPIGAGTDGTLPFTRRVTGDPAVSPDGATLAVPALFLDNADPVSDPGKGTVQSDGYGSVGTGVSRFNPALVLVPLGRDGTPDPGESATVLVAGDVRLSTASDATTAVRSYLSAATFTPDGDAVYATMEASRTVAVVSATPIHPDDATDTGMAPAMAIADSGGATKAFVSTDQAGFATSPTVFVGTDAGPRGVAFLDADEAWVHAFLDRSLGRLGAVRARDTLLRLAGRDAVTTATFAAEAGRAFSEAALDPDAEAGRRLFYSATDAQMAGSGAGVSCSTCHMDGRNDGLTWTFEHGVRQTPSLAGAVSETAPFTWTDQVPSVGEEARITSAGRMGGAGLSYGEALQVAAFIDGIRAVDVPERDAPGEAATRGKAIFERPDVGCATCHTGARYSDQAHYAMYGLDAVNTPTLVGIGATAPYLHDGSMATLEDVLRSARSGEMGDTSLLSDAELDDLAAYLRSL